MAVLSPRARQRAVLARQLLLGRTSLPLPSVLEQVGGLQAQYAPAMYIGLWSRVEGFRRQDLTDALHAGRVVQGTLLRATIHLVSAADYWPFALAVRSERRRWWLRTTKQPAHDLVSAAERLRAAFDRDEQLTAGQVQAVVRKERMSGIGLWVDLVRVPPSGTWERRRANLFALAERWVGPEPALSADDVLDLVVRRYLTGFGPATRASAAAWAGLPIGAVAAALDRVGAQPAGTDAAGELLLDLAGLPRPAPATPAPVRFLGTWEAVLLAHARGTGVLREGDRSRIFATRLPQSLPTFLVDGEVAGTWRFDGERVSIEPWRALGAPDRAAVDAEAERLTALHTD